jgi:diacylglycerol kinase (ATP)
MINTAIESVVDMTTTEYNEYAKIAKDVSAGAVLISAITASVTGMLLFYQNGRIWTIVLEYVKNPFFWVYIIVGLIYVFGIPFTFWRKK